MQFSAPRPVSADALALVLREPAQTAGWTGAQWSQLFRQARYSGLTGRLAGLMLQPPAASPSLAPPALRQHLEAALRLCQAQQIEVLREARHLDHALAGLEAPVVLLKGAAYAVANLPAARGRVFSDIDIMVPKAQLSKAEALLTLHGWMTTEESDYNQQYYRRWMHELPPMRHIKRGTVLDLHHTILPETARLKPDAGKLIAHARPLPGTQVLHVLSPVDMLLHSMTHLFMNDDVTHALRDLSDVDLLLHGADAADNTWAELVPRAAELDLGRPLYYALRQLVRVLKHPVPEAALVNSSRFAPGTAVGRAMDQIWSLALSAPVPPQRHLARDLALGLLYLRGHWLRMPPMMLMKHLSIKALGLHKPKQDRQHRIDPTQVPPP